MIAYGRATRLSRILRRGNRELDAVRSQAIPMASRASDARKVTAKISGRLAELALMDSTDLMHYLAETLRDPNCRISVRNLIRSSEHPIAAVHCAYPTPSAAEREIVVLMGLPASGKTTYIAKHLSSHTVVQLGKSNQSTTELCDAIHSTTDSIVVNGCHSNPQRHRAPIILVAQEACIPVRIIHIATAFAECKRRNHARPKEQRVSSFAFGGYQQYFVVPSINEGVFEVTTIAE